ncbi:MAG TPA: bifunctional (p)ppGpp synthetase/guanosine-3',5'-bis(diphosphate) 3'-pyrophosphohydrolase [Mizugakiibacter sp.]|nr:bifunctional (p)ppGpp synthetase/guanosine-3',5'-bis(diphosphate) 3'-pyrophosphohydrolase [Mizugakiibacter sp.]
MAADSKLSTNLRQWVDAHPETEEPLRSALDKALPKLNDDEVLVDTLVLLESLQCDAETLAATVWFALLQTDTPTDVGKVAQNPGVRRLIEGQQAAEKVWVLHDQQRVGDSAEGLRRLLLAIIRDLRVVFILLARQLARLRAAVPADDMTRRSLAALTADLHVPLANRLGIWQLKWELEDLVFRFLEPQAYQRIAALLDERRSNREIWIRDTRAHLVRTLDKAGIKAEVAGRPKHIYSIWKKMQRKQVDFSELYDIRALRVLTDNVADCYAVLGIVHQLWAPVPSEFDDYIARPKPNGYRSLHTAVLGPEGRTLEVQIRSHEMHRQSELGVAAHWRYKEGARLGRGFEDKITWMRKLLEIRHEGEDDQALLADFRSDLLEDRVYLLTPHGEVLDLPQNATVLDFAYHVHTEVGHRCRGAKVNGRIVPLSHVPQSGDRIEILTSKISQPSRDWLAPHQAYLTTGRARGKVRAWFRRIQLQDNLDAGRNLLDRELKRLGVESDTAAELPTKLNLRNMDDVYQALALGEIGSGQIGRALQAPPSAEPTALPPTSLRSVPHKAGELVIEGVGNLLLSLARCCQPLPGDPVRGYVTRGRGVSVHRADCRSMARLAQRDPDRVISVNWGQASARAYEADITLRAYERKELLKDVTSVLTQSGAQIIASQSHRLPDRGEVDMRYTLRVRDFAQLAQLLAKLVALPNVLDARRLARP